MNEPTQPETLRQQIVETLECECHVDFTPGVATLGNYTPPRKRYTFTDAEAIADAVLDLIPTGVYPESENK